MQTWQTSHFDNVSSRLENGHRRRRPRAVFQLRGLAPMGESRTFFWLIPGEACHPPRTHFLVTSTHSRNPHPLRSPSHTRVNPCLASTPLLHREYVAVFGEHSQEPVRCDHEGGESSLFLIGSADRSGDTRTELDLHACPTANKGIDDGVARWKLFRLWKLSWTASARRFSHRQVLCWLAGVSLRRICY